MYAWHQRPAIDCLMNQYHEDTHAQFGNARMVKELASVANQLGKTRTLCEAYGASGWDLRFEDMKRIGDWLYVLGVNTLDQHLSYVTIRGARKRDHPQSFSYHEPWWEAYHVMEAYFTPPVAGPLQRRRAKRDARVGADDHGVDVPAHCLARRQDRLLGNAGQLKEIGERFFNLVLGLSKAQVEYDVGSEDIIAGHGSVEGRNFVIGRRKYDTVVLPPFTETLNAKTIDLLEEYVKAGGAVLCCGDPPALVDGRQSDRGKAAATAPLGSE